MSGAIPPLPQYDFMVWCSVKAQGQLYLFTLRLLPFKFKPFQTSKSLLLAFFNSVLSTVYITQESRDSSVGIALGYELDDLDSGFRFLAGAGNFSLHHRVQNGSEAHPASYPRGTRSSFLGGKAAGA
jgi:hypothetical protein